MRFICIILIIGLYFDVRAEENADLSSSQRAQKLLVNEDYDAAEKEFRKLYRSGEKSPEIFYGLGKACFRKKQQRLLDARLYLRTAVSMDPSFTDAWIELGKVEEQFWPEEALEVYQKAVEAIPGNRYLYTKFIEMAVWDKDDMVTVETVGSLVESFPDVPEYLYNLAEAYHGQQRLDEASDMLDTLAMMFPDFSSSIRQLLKAKIAFDRQQDEIGWTYYKLALKSLKDPVDAEIFFEDLRYIMNDQELGQAKSLQISELGTFYQRFWRQRDPNLATEMNERAAEYCRRLTFARKNFWRFADEMPEHDSFYNDIHPFASYNTQGNKLLRLGNVPLEVLKNRCFDDLGLIYLRHGLPDQEVTSTNGLPSNLDREVLKEKMFDKQYWSSGRTLVDGSGEEYQHLPKPSSNIMPTPLDSLRIPRADQGESLMMPGYFDNIPMNVSWKYFETKDRPAMIFHFKKYGDIRGWIIESIPYALAERENLDTRFFDLAHEAFRPSPASFRIRELSSTLDAQAHESVKVAVATETSDFSFNAHPLDFPFELLSFKGEDGRANVELYYAINGQDIGLDNTPSGRQLNLKQFVGFYNAAWDEILRLEQPLIKPIELQPDQWRHRAIVDVVSFPVNPGKNHFEIHLRDNTTGRLGVYRGDHTIPDFAGDSLMMSDVLLTGEFGAATETSPYRKGEIAFTPHMFSHYREGELVGLYFEVYNLALDAQGRTDFRVSCSIQSLDGASSSFTRKLSGFFARLFSDEPSKVGTSYDYTGVARDEMLYVTFDVAAEKAGDYEMAVETTDKITGLKAIQKVPVTIR